MRALCFLPSGRRLGPCSVSRRAASPASRPLDGSVRSSPTTSSTVTACQAPGAVCGAVLTAAPIAKPRVSWRLGHWSRTWRNRVIRLASFRALTFPAYGEVGVGSSNLVPVPSADQVGERPLEEIVQRASQQAVDLAREQVDVARRELAARASRAGPGAAMVGGGALLAALASGTGTAALILVLAGRRGASAAALGVTGAYAGAGALLAREGLVRLREAGPRLPDATVEDEPAQDSEPVPPVKRPAKTAAKSARRTKSAADSLPRPTARPTPKPKAASSRRRTSSTQTGRARRRAS